MALIVGVLLIILGAVALVAWWTQVLIFIQGMVVFYLLFWGLMSLIVGLAGWKSKRQLKAALSDGPAPEDVTASPQPEI